MDPHLVLPSLSRHHSSPQMTTCSPHALLHKYATKSLFVTMRRSFLLTDLCPHLMHLSLDWPNSPPQTASRSNQPFFHNSSTG